MSEDQSGRSSLSGDAMSAQSYAMLAHAIFKASSFESPLAAKPTIIVCTMPYLAAIGLRRAGRTNNQSKGDKQSHAIAHHRRILPFSFSVVRLPVEAGGLASASHIRDVPCATSNASGPRWRGCTTTTTAFSTRPSVFTTPALLIANGVDSAAFGMTVNPTVATRAPNKDLSASCVDQLLSLVCSSFEIEPSRA
jgi:hypothetical protein